MTIARTFVLASSAIAVCAAAPAIAQDYQTDIPAEYQDLPPEYSAPAYPAADATTSTDGIETVTRTRWIRREPAMAEAPVENYAKHHKGYAYHAYQAYPVTYDRETWLEECYARTRGASKKEKGGIIGALLGAIGGGIIGNRVWDSERLAGTLIGGGVGGLAGLAIGSAIGGKDGDDRYDCEAALDRYMSGASYPMDHRASRAIPAHGQHYGYAPVYAYAPVMAYAAPQQVTMVEMREEIPQQVIVRENVREEWYEEMGSERVIEDVLVPAPAPRPIPIKRQSGKIQSIKGN